MMMNREGVAPTKPVPLDLRDAIGVSKLVLTDDNKEPVVVVLFHCHMANVMSHNYISYLF
jgi:hypothetical protein